MSELVATNTSPPAVTSGPPRGQCEPLSAGMPTDAGASTVPSGTCHLRVPVLRS